MAKDDMDQPETQQGDRDRDRDVNQREENKPGGSPEEIRGIADEEEGDEDFEETEDLDEEENEEGGV
jgi:hypothetical protein